MARPRSTSGGRPHVVSVRLSDTERVALDAARGGLKPADYLRTLIPGLRPTPEPVPVAPPIVEPLVTKAPNVANVHDELIPGPATHRHRRGVKIGEHRAGRGVIVQSFRCTEPGCTYVMEG